VPPLGRLLLAIQNDRFAGCVALQPLDANTCEMKRLFVRPACRARWIGGRLALAVIREAKTAGYATMRLDTLPQMTAAIALYEALGFRRSPAYYETPLANTLFMELTLR